VSLQRRRITTSLDQLLDAIVNAQRRLRRPVVEALEPSPIELRMGLLFDLFLARTENMTSRRSNRRRFTPSRLLILPVLLLSVVGCSAGGPTAASPPPASMSTPSMASPQQYCTGVQVPNEVEQRPLTAPEDQ
jgi:hypothetical protein